MKSNKTENIGGFSTPIPFKFASVFLLILNMFYIPIARLDAESIKFATLAPKGSTWMKNFLAMRQEIRAKTGGGIQFHIYSGGVQGDEIDVIRKMRSGLLHAGAMTATGLGEIQKEVLIFQLPRLFKTYSELDYVRDLLYEDIDKAFMDAGYVLLGVGDVGFYYMFSNEPIRTIQDLQSPSVRMWARVSAKSGLDFYERAGISVVPSEVTEVMAALYSGRVNAVTTSPYLVVALQWHDKFKYMTNLPMSVGVGAIVITKEKFDQFTPDQQQIVREITNKYQRNIIQQIRADNERAIAALQKKAGIKVVKFEEVAAWDAIAVETHKALVGEIYSQAFLDKINALLKAYREKN